MPSIETLKKIFGYFFEIRKFCNSYKFCSLIHGGIQYLILFILINIWYFNNSYPRKSNSDREVSSIIVDSLDKCGQNNYITLMTVGINKLDARKNYVNIDDLLALDGNNKINTFKFNNEAFLQQYLLSFDDYDYLQELPNGSLVSCDFENNIPSCPKYTPQILSTIAQKLNLKYKYISFAIIKTQIGDIIKIVSFNVADGFNKCDRYEVNTELLKISTKIKDTL